MPTAEEFSSLNDVYLFFWLAFRQDYLSADRRRVKFRTKHISMKEVGIKKWSHRKT
jgi:hypothetical protein